MDLYALVTKLLDRKEWIKDPKAVAKVREEFDGLTGKDTWDLDSVDEHANIVHNAKLAGKTVHIANIMSICSRKYDELPKEYHQLKGRIVYRGDNAKDQNGALTIYQSLSASPATITAANAVIAFGQLPGSTTTSADVVKAYVQAPLGSLHETWVRLPWELWPESWKGKYKKPLIRLRKSLYGHPHSGAHWARYLERAVVKLGGQPVDGHPSTFFFKERNLLLTVYVDDLLLSGSIASHTPFWEELGKVIEIEDIGDLGRFLGSHHELVRVNGREGIAFNVREYMKSAVEMYLKLSGAETIEGAPTPFLPKGSILPEEWEEKGQLEEHACAVLMKLLWGARLGRPDVLRAITHLATLVSKWSKACDRMLHRLMAYVSQSTDYTLVGYINDLPEDLWLEIYTDSDFSGSPDCAHSTSGAWLQLRGPNSVWPPSWASKKQTAVSRSTTEAEVIAMVFGAFSEALPMEVLWGIVLQREIHTIIYEDNEATEKIVRSGFSQKLRHMTRTHKVNLGSLCDVVASPDRTLKHVTSVDQIADVFTKAVEQQGWQNALRLLGMTTSVPETVRRSMAGFKLQQDQKPQ